jgi:hypothetical protein
MGHISVDKYDQLSMVVYVHYPSYLGDGGRRTIDQGRPGQNHKNLSKNKLEAKEQKELGNGSNGRLLDRQAQHHK